jgi:flavin reductase (DIM6/NTAB) family NADH-FMN oxidoreductase RutF
MPSTRSAFDELALELDYTMIIVTCAAGNRRAGCLVGFATQTSIHPGRFLVCISRKNHTFGVAAEADVLAVHFVPVEAMELAQLFGGETGDEVDKFERCAWRPGPGGAPILDDLPDWFAGRVLERSDLGDHVGHLLAPIDGEAGRGARPLTFHRARRTIEPGHAP